MRGVADAPSIYSTNIKTTRDEDGETLTSSIRSFGDLVVPDSGVRSFIGSAVDDPILSRTTLEALDAFADPLINNLFVNDNTLTDKNIEIVRKFSDEVVTTLGSRELIDGNLPLEDRVALKIKHGIPLSRTLVNWFWNSTDGFDLITRTIIEDIDPPYIRPITEAGDNIDSGIFDDTYKLNSKNSITQTDTL
jgi:hypothetical protein